MLASVYGAIAECEMQLNRPLACRAALETVLCHQAANAQVRKALQGAFGDESSLPRAARQAYQLKPPAADTPPPRKQVWKQALDQHSAGQLTEARKAFEQLVAENADDTLAWYDLALICAWLGDNVAALAALEEYVPRELDEAAAAAAWALGEVLRCGPGIPESQSDYLEYAFVYQLHDGGKIERLLEQLNEHRRLAGGQVDENQQIFTAVLTQAPKLVVGAVPQTMRFGAHLTLVQQLLRISSPNRQSLLLLAAELEELAAGALQQRRETSALPSFQFVLIEAIVFPTTQLSDEEFKKQLKEGTARFFEETWIQRPLHSLSNFAPRDAAGDASLRKKLRGVIQFLEDCARAQKNPYDFDQLRQKLRLQTAGPTATAPSTVPDMTAMSAADLAGLSRNDLSDEQLELAYQTARKQNARELATSLLQTLVSRPPRSDKPDRFSWYGQLIQQATEENDTGRALEYVAAGEKADREQNEGRRHNEYELWRGRLHARRGELDQAQEVFDRLIASAPSELRYRSTAAEAMLSARDGPRALRFAEAGLSAARQQKDRDSEEHLLELANAAKKRT
jgi:tetratricopeptide (TPR) repeat protein